MSTPDCVVLTYALIITTASFLNLWGLLPKDFVYLVGIAFCLATPLAYYFLNQ